MKKFFLDRPTDCKHSYVKECETNECWYFINLTGECFHALHAKGKHTSCAGEYITGLTTGDGAALYAECKCLCHQGKYYSPLSGRWV